MGFCRDSVARTHDGDLGHCPLKFSKFNIEICGILISSEACDFRVRVVGWVRGGSEGRSPTI